jgi:3-hydroxybutyryl-CoA dehydrogenase
MAEIVKVGVVGCGLMGHGIAQVAAEAGYEVVVREVDEGRLSGGIGRIEKQLARAVERGKASQEDADSVRGRITGTLSYDDFGDCDLVLEAITEDLGLKLQMWAEIDRVAKPDAFYATNTSSLPVIAQAARTSRPDRFLGIHFFNPAQVMKLVEVVRCVTTSDEAMALGVGFAERLGKLPVQTKDKVGFIVNRLLIPFVVDGIRGFEEGIGSITEIDTAMKAGAAHPMGPLTLADFIGLDTIGSVCDVMYDEWRERRFAQPATLRKMLAAGWLGRKSGLGFYDYSGPEPVENPGLSR